MDFISRVPVWAMSLFYLNLRWTLTLYVWFMHTYLVDTGIH